jgi:serine/threonine protein kinase
MERPSWYEIVPEEDKAKWDEINASPHYSCLYYTPVCDGTLADLRRELLDKGCDWLFLELLAQQLHILGILFENDWVHRDVHPKNWMYIEEKESYHLYLIDYGLAKHKDFPTNENDTKWEPLLDIATTIEQSIWIQFEYNLSKKWKRDVCIEHKEDITKAIAKHRLFREIKQYLPKLDKIEGDHTETLNVCLTILFFCEYPREYYKMILEREFHGQLCDACECELRLSHVQRDTIRYLIGNIHKPEKCVEYISRLLNI